MSFVWPPMLLALLLLPLLIVLYVGFVSRQNDRRTELASRSLVVTGDSKPSGRRRHLPFALFLAAITLLLIGFARPELVIGFPRTEGTVIVAIDSSSSMSANDAEPTRLDVAKQAAIEFVDQRPSDMTIGLVSFTNGAVVTQAPTKAREDLVAAIERLRPEGPTSLGQGIFTALGAIAGDPIPVEVGDGTPDLASIDIGFYSSAVILVFSDGENTTDFDPIEVAKLAANSGVKIFAVGVGTSAGAVVELDGFTVATQLDSDALAEMADLTDGRYFETTEQVDFGEVYDAVETELRIDAEKTEATALVGLLAMVLLLISAGLSMRWTGRVVS
jgi:Ca-activated chloride channel family protein